MGRPPRIPNPAYIKHQKLLDRLNLKQGKKYSYGSKVVMYFGEETYDEPGHPAGSMTGWTEKIFRVVDKYGDVGRVVDVKLEKLKPHRRKKQYE